MANKTPFEIRFDLLNLAQSILMDKNWAERNRLEQDWNASRDVALNQNDHPPHFPSLPIVSTDEIIAEAKKLNEFVSNG